MKKFAAFCGNETKHLIQDNLPFFLTLSHINLLRVPPAYNFKVHFNINLPFTSKSSMWSLSFGISHQIAACSSTLPHTRYMLRLSHLLDLTTRIIVDVEYQL